MSKARVATIWLDGCSGCHMSFLDLDERLIELSEKMDLVYSPLVDFKEFPEEVDVTLVEGSVSNEGDLHKILLVREHTRILVSLGDCAVTGNVPAMRNPIGVDATFTRAYSENVTLHPQKPHGAVPALLETVKPVHQVVPVDVIVAGCPPSASTIYYVVSELLAGRLPEMETHTRFGA